MTIPLEYYTIYTGETVVETHSNFYVLIDRQSYAWASRLIKLPKHSHL